MRSQRKVNKEDCSKIKKDLKSSIEKRESKLEPMVPDLMKHFS